jgi:putative ABC transport system substrate-binding protein
MRRREFITLVGGATAWPVAARAQQVNRVRHVGILFGGPESAEFQARLAAFRQELRKLGWIEGDNILFDLRFGGADPGKIRKHAAELAALAPDVILASGSTPIGPMLQATRTAPIIFVNVADPVGSGFVESLSRPGRNATGFMIFEYSLTGKWLELLKELAPDIKRAAVLRDPTITAGIGQFAVVQSVAPSLGMDVISINLRDASEIEHGIEAFVRSGGGGLIQTASALAAAHRNLTIELAAKHKLPAIYPARPFVAAGGLVSYAANLPDQYRRAATYVDRVLKGEKPADLPVQAPTKYELVINLKTAKALGLTVPPSMLARADEVIE